mmetsp:Transcript_75227/g.208318  ORF Transcript_75227/g.208318 Transcript_75227/m.208318 type:complete len:249 (+) Transcript_75227:114-860(+)
MSKYVQHMASEAHRKPAALTPEYHNARRSRRGCAKEWSSCSVASVTPSPPRRSRRSSRQPRKIAAAPASVDSREATVRSWSPGHAAATRARPASETQLSKATPACISLCGPSQRCRRQGHIDSAAQARSPSGAKTEADRSRAPAVTPLKHSRSRELMARLRSCGRERSASPSASSVTSPTSRQESGKTRSCCSRGHAATTRRRAGPSVPWQPCSVSATRLAQQLSSAGRPESPPLSEFMIDSRCSGAA